jgi:hypothetical protein
MSLDMTNMDVNDVLESPEFKPNDATSMQQLWQRYKVQLQTSYDTPDAEAQAFAEFQKTVKMVMEHNAEYKQGKTTWTMGLNQFADGTKPAMGVGLPPNWHHRATPAAAPTV